MNIPDGATHVYYQKSGDDIFLRKESSDWLVEIEDSWAKVIQSFQKHLNENPQLIHAITSSDNVTHPHITHKVK